ncbi:FUSC family protein [Georgenia sp. 10Sc9-8]|uniref:FUSC family protein n=1 Tax=Georgenia halotolerans TaxID=3028317 RepID=A0ABT5TYS6_9MICO|nr:FUSC family protein [Georgenia halotolerans]
MSPPRAGTGRHAPDPRELWVVVTVRVRAGARRVRRSAFPVLSAAVAAAVAFWVSGEVLGHEAPIFAPIAAWVCLGFSADRQLRRVAELGAGVTLGVVMGEVFLALFGSGPVQIGAVLVIAGLSARFLDRGQLFTMQAGVQGLVLVGMPALAALDGGFGRWTDALVGAAIALVVAAAAPGDVRRRPRELARASIGEIAQMLQSVAAALRDGDPQRAADALAQGRGSQPVLDEWESALRNARESVRLSPALRRESGSVAELARAWTLVDRAMRNARVIARRAHAAAADGAEPEVADLVAQVAQALHDLGAAIGQEAPTDKARAELVAVAAELRPERFAPQGWRAQTVVPLLRSLVVDALQLTGMTLSEAGKQLPEG